ncbi:MAG: tRNA (5-methylaminomethyl-2-thiouridylate)-methyltransferase [Chloroflexi bacterium]|nr:tRNA (5-methylaminomethyl-2-thiouridylate)-methyltransferase [Chloroflexota bacterium]
MKKKERIKAVGMLSGGLDSTLAIRVMLEQNIEVTALHFRTTFSYVERSRLAGRGPAMRFDAEWAATTLGVDLQVIDVSDEYLPLVLNPRYGYGSGMNPCVDCRIFLLRQAKMWMKEHGYHFVFTGEVVGQRPKSQMRPSLNTVERESGLRGYLLRPLSAKLLKTTVPEERGWVNREKLYAINGRGRKPQIALAEQFGITDYTQPSGGCCYLIDKTYSRRLNDFLTHDGAAAIALDQVQLLAVGRHIRLISGCKVIVGRHERENDYLENCNVKGVLLTTMDHPGPTTLVPGKPLQADVELAARITAGYSDGNNEPAVRVVMRDATSQQKQDEPQILTVEPMEKERVKTLMV